MSQAKVDRYKKEKADRKKTMRKEKINFLTASARSGQLQCAIARIFSSGFTASFATCSAIFAKAFFIPLLLSN